MVDRNRTVDVFISHSSADAALASALADTCRANGLDALTHALLPPGAEAGDALWDALAESRALLVFLSPAGLSPSMAIEVGAARAWNKPIFGLVTDPSLTQLPAGLTGVPLYPTARIEDVIQAIKVTGQELSDEDRSMLAAIYTDLGVSVDELALVPGELGKLVQRFTARAGKMVAGERLLSELLRMRKQGRLTKGSPAGRTRPHRGTA